MHERGFGDFYGTAVKKHIILHHDGNRDQSCGSQVGIAKYRMQYGQILLFDEANRINGSSLTENHVK